jgi:hypothetical protein
MSTFLSPFFPPRRSVQHDRGLGDEQPRLAAVVGCLPGVREGVLLTELLCDGVQRRFLVLVEDDALVGADHRAVAVGVPLPPVVDRIGLAIDHVDHGRGEVQVADILHGVQNLIDMTTIFRRNVVARAEHAVVGGQGDQHRGDRRAVVAADRQNGGEVVANVLGMGEDFAVGLGGMGAEAERRPVVNGEQDLRPRGHFLPHHRVHRFDQGRLLDARVDAKPPQLLGEGSRLEPGNRGPGAAHDPVFPKPLMRMA